MKVLILYPYSNHDRMVEHMVHHLRLNGVNADAFNYIRFTFSKSNIIKHSHFLNSLMLLLKIKNRYLNKLIRLIVGYDKIIIKLSEKYDIIDFHVFNKVVDRPLKKIYKNKLVKITIWGSDFYRSNKSRREEQRLIYQKCNKIQLITLDMKRSFLDYYQSFEEKIRVANFGVNMFEDIQSLDNSSFIPLFKTDNRKNKLMVVCGYNGSKGQQHITIIDALQQISQKHKNEIFLVFPMTYGADCDYIELINDKLIDLSIEYVILQNHLRTVELAKLRLETDLVINIQLTDALSGSLQEHIYAENLLLLGDWLPYSIFDKNDIYYRKTDVENLKSNIEDCVVNIEKYRTCVKGNRDKINSIASWSVAAKNISNIYKEMMNEFS